MKDIMIKKLNEEERPRERLIKYGVNNLSNEELIAIILKTGSKTCSSMTLARQLLSKLKSIKDLNYEEMGRYRRLLFRKNPEPETLKDHVDVLFNSTNFSMKPSTFTETFFFSDKKKYDTDHQDMEHHFKKKFMMTFACEKMKQKFIIRK